MSATPVVLFDLDDTLYYERDYQRSGWRAVAEEAGRRGLIDAEAAYRMMCQAPDAFDALHDAFPSYSVADMLTVYRGHMPAISLRPTAREVMSRLRAEGMPLGIITDGRSAGQRNKISALGLDAVVDYIGISEEIGADKYSALPFELPMRQFGENRPYVYVGDNPAKDFLIPGAMGWHTVMLAEGKAGSNVHPQNLDEWPDDCLPEFIIEDLQELPLICSRISGNDI